ncbi:TetR/AcrR family transcriptional regulator [Sporosarcina sp. CAU 1771]
MLENLILNVEIEKRDRIINSAMKEFCTNSFQKASTNTIVEDAGISKGLLFHYFGNKEKLYKYLEYFSIKVITEGIINEMNWDQKDIFVRLKEVSMIKFKILQKYPYLSEFSLMVFKDKTAEEIMCINPDFSLKIYNEIYTRNIDYSLFKEDVDTKKALDIIRWTIEKCGEEIRSSIENGNMEFDFKGIEKEIYSYIDMLKVCFYK